jgi:hypothetical protein
MAKSKSRSKVPVGSTRSKKVEEKPKEVDYAEAADEFADETEESEQEEQSADEEVSDDNQDGSEDDEQEEEEDEESIEEEEDEESEEEEEDEEVDDVDALFRGSAADGDEEEDDDDDSSGDEARQHEKEAATAVVKAGPEQCNFDLRNMTAMNSHQIPASSLYSKERADDSPVCIPLEDEGLMVDEDYLLERASAGCSQLIAAIWQLPTESSDAGPLAALPAYDEIPIPRSMVRRAK